MASPGPPSTCPATTNSRSTAGHALTRYASRRLPPALLDTAVYDRCSVFTESEILTALRDCYDPNIPCNIVDLGMVHQIHLIRDHEAPGADIPGVPQRHRVTVTILPATHDEAANSQLSAQIANRLAGLEMVSHSQITLLESPAWSPQRITPAGRKQLGLDGNPHLIQIAPVRN